MKTKLSILLLAIILFACGNAKDNIESVANNTPQNEQLTTHTNTHEVEKISYEEVIKAIEKNDLQTFDRLIIQIPNIDSLISEYGTESSYTLLGYACKYKNCDIAKKLIDLKASIETAQSDEFFEYDALSIAVESQDTCLVKLLLEKGANPNRWYSEDGFTALSLSCMLNNYTISKILIENGAKINGEGDTGTDYINYPLLHAVESNNINLVKLLINNGCKIEIKDKQGETPFTIAERNNNKQMSDLLLKQLQEERTLNMHE